MIKSNYNKLKNSVEHSLKGGAQVSEMHVSPQASLSGVIYNVSVSGGSAPSGTVVHYLDWYQIGKVVTVRTRIQWATPGTNVIGIRFNMPQNLPMPAVRTFPGIDVAMGSGIGSAPGTATSCQHFATQAGINSELYFRFESPVSISDIYGTVSYTVD